MNKFKSIVFLLALFLLVGNVALYAAPKKKNTKKTENTSSDTDTNASTSTSTDSSSSSGTGSDMNTSNGNTMTNESGQQVTTADTSAMNTPAPGSGDVMSDLANAKTEVMKLPWTQEISGKRTPMAYAYIRESDVFWWKNVWRVIDCREKLNLHFKWPKNPLINILLDAIKTGKVPVYSGMDDDFTTPVDPKDAMNVAGGGTDSIYVTNPETGIQELQVITKEVNWNNVNKYRLKEVWYFDKQHSTMQVRIMGICPLWDNYTTDPMTGEDIYRGEVPIFWVYFPSLRDILVNNEAYNPFPNGIRLNWDQVFALRLFSSYIYKVDNVQDFRIKDYKSGIDILYESEAKKQELFNFEHDLWEY